MRSPICRSFVDHAQEVYIAAHKLLADRDYDGLHEYVTEKIYPEMKYNVERKTVFWQFIKSLEPPRAVSVRVMDVLTKASRDEIVNCECKLMDIVWNCLPKCFGLSMRCTLRLTLNPTLPPELSAFDITSQNMANWLLQPTKQRAIMHNPGQIMPIELNNFLEVAVERWPLTFK